MQVQHPRATPVDGRSPPSQVSIPGHGNVTVDEDGYLDVEEAAAERAMTLLADAYDVEYTDDGDVVFEEDGPPDDDVEPPFDPSDYTIDELEAELAERELSDDERSALLKAEREGDGRTGAVDAIEEA